MIYEQRTITIHLGYSEEDRHYADILHKDILRVTDNRVVSDILISDPIITTKHPPGENREEEG